MSVPLSRRRGSVPRGSRPWYLALAWLAAIPMGHAAAPIQFLGRPAAARAIIDDHEDPYFSTLQPMEMAAKTGRALRSKGLAAQRAETRRRYQAGVRAFSAPERAAITWMAHGIDAAVAPRYPRLAQVPWRFLKVANNIEGGLPHTRGPYIVLSQAVCDELLAMRAQLLPRAALAAGMTILLHERIHVLQREAPALFTSLYHNVWGFVHVKSITTTPWLRRHHLANPDGLDCRWIFPLHSAGNDQGPVHYIWPLIVFSAGPGLKRMPQDFRMLAIDVRREGDHATVISDANGRPRSRPLLSVKQYTRVFAISDNIYHPNEAAADLLTQLVLFDALVDTSGIPPQRRAAVDAALAPVRLWANTHLGVSSTTH